MNARGSIAFITTLQEVPTNPWVCPSCGERLARGQKLALWTGGYWTHANAPCSEAVHGTYDQTGRKVYR